MFTNLLRLEAQGFSRASSAIALRSVATCPNLIFRPLSRPIIGVALLSVIPEAGGRFHFLAQSTALRDGALPGTLADWIEPRLPATGPLISWETDDTLITKLRGVVREERHPRIASLLSNPNERLRVLPREVMGHLRRGVAPGVPCFCRCAAECQPELPAFLLPDPEQLERELVGEAETAWAMWADLHAAIDDDVHPARIALRCLAERRRLRGELPLR